MKISSLSSISLLAAGVGFFLTSISPALSVDNCVAALQFCAAPHTRGCLTACLPTPTSDAHPEPGSCHILPSPLHNRALDPSSSLAPCRAARRTMGSSSFTG